MRTMTAFDLGVLAGRSAFEKTAMGGPLLGPQAPAKPLPPGNPFEQFKQRPAVAPKAPVKPPMAVKPPAPPANPNMFAGGNGVPAHETPYDLTNDANAYHYNRAIQRSEAEQNRGMGGPANTFKGRGNIPTHQTPYDLTNNANEYHYNLAAQRSNAAAGFPRR